MWICFTRMRVAKNSCNHTTENELTRSTHHNYTAHKHNIIWSKKAEITKVSYYEQQHTGCRIPSLVPLKIWTSSGRSWNFARNTSATSALNCSFWLYTAPLVMDVAANKHGMLSVVKKRLKSLRHRDEIVNYMLKWTVNHTKISRVDKLNRCQYLIMHTSAGQHIINSNNLVHLVALTLTGTYLLQFCK